MKDHEFESFKRKIEKLDVEPLFQICKINFGRDHRIAARQVLINRDNLEVRHLEYLATNRIANWVDDRALDLLTEHPDTKVEALGNVLEQLWSSKSIQKWGMVNLLNHPDVKARDLMYLSCDSGDENSKKPFEKLKVHPGRSAKHFRFLALNGGLTDMRDEAYDICSDMPKTEEESILLEFNLLWFEK